MPTFSSRTTGLLILRLGLSIVLLWFGFSQLFDGINWVALVPDWAANLLHLPPAIIILINGSFEVVAGLFLAVGVWTRWLTLLLALHLALITFVMGLTSIGVRDFGLATAALSLFFLEEKSTKNI